MCKIKTFNVKQIMLILLCLSLLININYISAKACQIQLVNKPKNILIDPGHGGIDGGAVSKNGTVEKDLNLKISQQLKKSLEQKGYTVVMTRDSDIGLYSEQGRVRDKKNEDLNNRCKIKDETKCDLFISIHLNMFPQVQYYGAQVWYSKEGESAILARIMQKNFVKDLDKNNKRQEKCAKGAYKILRCSDDIPSVLVECGFLSNAMEEEKLKKEEYQQQIADSLAKSVDEYFSRKEEENSNFDQ